ncbi:hypothetical protein GLYMA_03G213100v4 [Glycine max]|uniref:Heat shock factor binding protein n=1 Tax=Glycine max TaxID=3847 RepID=K7KGB2_SOYBN|nr:hypothetical protein JHK86_008135 [Glycine max]KAH1071124.1 hypothetical protein GYH30_007936 [Glycine max]KRH68168.1 hypothetical protein GLYMA_03G213100v4 [Glycine max]
MAYLHNSPGGLLFLHTVTSINSRHPPVQVVICWLSQDGQRCQFYYIIIGSNCSSNVFLDIVIALDEMGDRINELEQSINDLRSEMGVESTPSPVAPAKPKEEESNKEEGSA